MAETVLEIIPAKEGDLDRILEIYEIARGYMRRNGNMKQWNGSYPDRETLQEDIAKERLYVCRREKHICGAFVLMSEKEPTYDYIEDGRWLNEKPYATLHRIASSGEVRGMFGQCLDFARRSFDNIRVDTHHDNHTMQHLAEKYGFQRCGVIYVRDGTPRIAYHYVEKTI